MKEKIEEMNFKINPKRFRYILDLYNLSKEEFLNLHNEGRKKNLLTIDDLNKILSQDVDVDIGFLKRIDKFFQQGITWYITKRDIPDVMKSSIFFRKDSFNSDLNLESRKIIKNFEELKFELSSLCKQINYKPEKKLDVCSSSDDPKVVAQRIREKFDEIENDLLGTKYIKKPYRRDRVFLENLIRIMENLNIFVFEVVDRNKKPEKEVKFNGFYMAPNVIVIKRQKYLRREIFTLLHELAHYLLDFEEIDENIESQGNLNQSNVESWCNTFAFSFLINDYKDEFYGLKIANRDNQFLVVDIKNLYDKTYLSELALYTRLVIEGKISSEDYTNIKNKIIASVKSKEKEEKLRYEEEKNLAKEQGRKFKGGGPKEIRSFLFEEILRVSYFSGIINESKLRERLNIKSNVGIEDVIY